MKRMSLRLLTVLLGMMIFCTGAQAKTVPYTVELDESTEIYQGHGVDYGYSERVGEDGVYTIVEEAYDEYGALWGRLKSGAGWVMLAEAEQIEFRETPYTTRLDAWDDICEGPGYAYEYVGLVGEDGVYTIMEEALCEDGFLWGRLKSGAGWVRLTDAAVMTPSVFYEADYRVSLGAWTPIYSAPSYEKGICTGIVGEDGVYTIVGETLTFENVLWGKLKSGAGWVNLDDVQNLGDPLITAYFADDVIEEGSEYSEYFTDDPEYALRIAFRANEFLKNVELTSLEYNAETYEVYEELHQVRWLFEGEYLVANVVFYGDMTAYGVSFEDIGGTEHHYAVMLSGKDGTIVMNEYIPAAE